MTSLPPAALQEVQLAALAPRDLRLAVLRLDQRPAAHNGNKGYKLRPWRERLARGEGRGLISLGGAHSNHLHALAALGREDGFATVGLLRGEPCLTPTVQDLQAQGMTLHWLGYGGYRRRHDADFWQPWQARYPGLLPIPEGAATSRPPRPARPSSRSCARASPPWTGPIASKSGWPPAPAPPWPG